MTSDEQFLTRTIRLAGRRRRIDAPVGDIAFSRHRSGGGYRSYGEFCRGTLTPGSVVIDIGANIGLTAIVAADFAHRGRVIAIEGAPRNFAALTRNLGAHAPDITTAVHCAVGAESGEASFIDNSAFGHVTQAGTMVEGSSTKVPLRTLDDIVVEQGLTRVDMMKLDIEGFEQDALAGAQETLDRFKPIVFLEFNVLCQIALYDRNPRHFLDWLLDRFPELHVWRDSHLVSVRELGSLGFLMSNMIDHRCNDDLVAAASPDRLQVLRGNLHRKRRFGGWFRYRTA